MQQALARHHSIFLLILRRMRAPLILLIALWQGLVTAMELPPYLVPSPILMMKTLFTDWAALGGSLWVTVKITVLAFVVATVAGVLLGFAVPVLGKHAATERFEQLIRPFSAVSIAIAAGLPPVPRDSALFWKISR